MNPNAVMTTSWDDGHPLDYRLAELLLKYGLKGTFYIPEKAQNVTMPAKEIAELSRYFEIGAHTMRHTFLDRVSDLIAEREIGESRQWIEEITGKPCTMFCPPGGRFNRQHLRLVEKAGYSGIRSVELLSMEHPQCEAGVMVLPTSIQAYPHTRGTYVRNASKRLAVKNLLTYLVKPYSADWVALAECMLKQAAAHGGVFHVWGHSWEIEQSGQWENVERLFAIMQQYLPDMECITNGTLCQRSRTAQSRRPAA